MNINEILTKERIEFVREKRKEIRDAAFVVVKEKIGSDAARELENLYSLFDEKIYIWLAGLWDIKKSVCQTEVFKNIRKSLLRDQTGIFCKTFILAKYKFMNSTCFHLSKFR